MTMPSEKELLEAFEELVDALTYLLDRSNAHTRVQLDKCNALIDKAKKERERREANHRYFQAHRKEMLDLCLKVPGSEGTGEQKCSRT